MTAPTKPSEALRAARELLTPEGAWIQEAFAQDATGHPVSPRSENAVCWCVMGALKRNDWNLVGIFAEAFRYLCSAVDEWAPDWNDKPGRTQAEVLTAFSKAISLAEEAGQ